MKYKMFFLVSILILLTSCKNNESQNVYYNKTDNSKEITVNSNKNNIQLDSKNAIGTWKWRSDDKSQEFTIKIKKVEKDSVFGQYCAVYNNGNKLDCDFNDKNNLQGLLIKDKIQLNFYSFFGAKNGKAEIKILKNHIEWKVIKSPEGEYYSPESATLYRKNDKKETLQNKSNLSNKKVQLPFDFQKYMDLCYLEENSICDEKFPFLKNDELSSITHLINNKINKNNPDRIYPINNSGQNFQTYVVQIKDENTNYLLTFYLINVKDKKIIANQLIGQSIDGEAPENVTIINKTFIINKDLTVSVFDQIYKKKNKLSVKYKINSDGTVKSE